jgi:hypothetical protein
MPKLSRHAKEIGVSSRKSKLRFSTPKRKREEKTSPAAEQPSAKRSL